MTVSVTRREIIRICQVGLLDGTYTPKAYLIECARGTSTYGHEPDPIKAWENLVTLGSKHISW
jgi:hypothetical protein